MRFLFALMLALAATVTPEVALAGDPTVAAQDQAIAYNDRLIGLQDRVGTSLLALFTAFDGGSANARPALAVLQSETASVLAEAKTIPPFNGDASLRDAFIPLLQFYSDAANTEFPLLISLVERAERGEDVTVEATAAQTRISEREAAADAAFGKAQNDFATKWNFSLTPNELQEKFDAQ